MCGIAGVYNFRGQPDENLVQKMIDSLQHRGPDGQGLWNNNDKNVVLGHRRLAIIDLMPEAAQPMHYRGRYTITFNGELYNYIEIRELLVSKGHQFKTESDTEVLMAAYAEFGTEMFPYLDGMFAFAIYDNETREMICARDRFGEKPFYYYRNAACFSFASEMKAFFHTGVQNSMDELMMYNYLVFDLLENPARKDQTFYKNIFKLEAAHYLIIKPDATITKKRYWNLQKPLGATSIAPKDAFDKFRELFFTSVKRRMRSDVPVGISLSGGLDSSTITCTINHIRDSRNSSIHTFSARFFDQEFDEGRYIDYVISKTGVQNHQVWVDEKDIERDYNNLMYQQEEPVSGLSAMAQYMVMRIAKENGITVLLDGQGADEILAGYSHFFRPFFTELFKSDSGNFNKELGSYKKLYKKDFEIDLRFMLEARFPNTLKYFGSFKRNFSEPSYDNFLTSSFSKNIRTVPPFQYFNSLNETLDYFTTVYGLEKLLRLADKNSMAHSREVRLPFLNHELVEFLFSLPPDFKIKDGWTKYILRRSFEDILPPEISWRTTKFGFQPPQETWANIPWVSDIIKEAEKYLIKQGIIKPNSFQADKAWRYLDLYTLMNMKY
jgi:asparagine synthase (glutamine-hydrolysing)